MKAPRFKLEQLPEKYRKQAEEQLRNEKKFDLQNRDGWNNPSVSECREQKKLALSSIFAADLADPTVPLLVRICRQNYRQLDDDNFIGGCKELRDAITTMLGRKGDSEKDGLFWEYEQKIGEPKTIIEIYKIEKGE